MLGPAARVAFGFLGPGTSAIATLDVGCLTLVGGEGASRDATRVAVGGTVLGGTHKGGERCGDGEHFRGGRWEGDAFALR